MEYITKKQIRKMFAEVNLPTPKRLIEGMLHKKLVTGRLGRPQNTYLRKDIEKLITVMQEEYLAPVELAKLYQKS